MDSISETNVDFNSFEQQCYDMGMALARMLMTTALENLDNKLLETRDKTAYRAKDLRPLTIKTLMGEVTVNRRLYRFRGEDGHTEYVHLLDLPAPSEESDAYGPMGAMESTVCGVVALRMKKRRASFTKDGATCLARFLCLKRSGELDKTLCGLSEMRIPRALEETISTVLSAAKVPKQDGNGYGFPRNGGLSFKGAATTNGRMAIKSLVSLRGFADLEPAQVGGW